MIEIKDIEKILNEKGIKNGLNDNHGESNILINIVKVRALQDIAKALDSISKNMSGS